MFVPGVAVDKSKFKSIESTSSQASEDENEDEVENKDNANGISKASADDDPDAAIRGKKLLKASKTTNKICCVRIY